MAKTKPSRTLEGAKFGTRTSKADGTYAFSVSVAYFPSAEAEALLLGARLDIVATNSRKGDMEGQEVIEDTPVAMEPLKAIVDVRKFTMEPERVVFTMEFAADADGALLDRYKFGTHKLKRTGDVKKADDAKDAA